MDKNQEELKQLSQSFAKLSDNLKKIQADMPKDANPQNDMMNKCMSAMYNIADNLHNRMDRMSNSNYEWQDNHTKNSTHLPKLTHSQHKELLKACKADADYKVEKPVIYTRASNGNFEVELDFKK